jgi:hypothetical protein
LEHGKRPRCLALGEVRPLVGADARQDVAHRPRPAQPVALVMATSLMRAAALPKRTTSR